MDSPSSPFYRQNWNGRLSKQLQSCIPKPFPIFFSFPTASTTGLGSPAGDLVQLKPASFFYDCVQHLLVKELPVNQLEEILSVCSGVKSLALFQRPGPLTPALGAMRPLPPIFTFVTHLDLYTSIQEGAGNIVGHLALFPALTHLAGFYSGYNVFAVLERCPKLEALIDMHPPLPQWAQIPIEDPRFVSMEVSHECHAKEYANAWVMGTRGGMDFWARADAFIAKKRRGEITPSTRCWIEEADGIWVPPGH
ncbi:hypothetical protein B0H13DRAFT_1891044 [Mycena leptocephala]|nr:hypothetical protein B0H13DRAFT_1891044 [Mycena leptocephala]